MANTMMQLGPVQFSIETAAYDRLSRSTEYRWARQSRIGSHDALQFTGYGADDFDIAGKIYPHYKGGLGQPAKMRFVAGFGVPMPLVSGTGSVLGLFCILSIGETQTIFAKHGIPMRQDFNMKITRYGGVGLRSILSI